MKLSFIWHMHQPDYRNKEGIMQMPWVFLHAIKDYYDMPWMLSKHPSVKASFNITVPLIQQLECYIQTPERSDKFLALWVQTPSELHEQERKWLIKMCKSTHFETMVTPLKRYTELYANEHCDDNELVDLEVLFLLAWCGNYLQQKNETVKSLRQKGRNFDAQDKAMLLAELRSFVAKIWIFYKKLVESRQITLSTTPYAHPILPLLTDMYNAKRAHADTNIPKNYINLEKDAKLHISRAKSLFKKMFGYDTDGFWPAEGAVDTRSVELMHEAGIAWIATDEVILYKSLNTNSKENIYKPYKHKDTMILFRDHYLSDLIGFEYRYKDPTEAADHFMGELQKIEKEDEESHAFVILDGENAWEFYKNNGYDFFEALYGAFEANKWCETMRMDEVKLLPSAELEYLAPGSWIDGSFDTWVGESEKTEAWELLYLAKKDYMHHASEFSDELRLKIGEEFLLAESSDWFWWYGSDHYSDFALEFDALFRSHLITVYELMEMPVPTDLFASLLQHQNSGNFWVPPQSDIHPKIDGRRDSFFEWMGCGVVDESKLFSSMQKSTQVVEKIYYGQDEKALYFAFEGDLSSLCTTATLNIIIDTVEFNKKIALSQKKTFIGGLEIESACKEWLELSIEKKEMSAQSVSLRFELLSQDGKILQTLPGFGELEIHFDDDYAKNWFV